jgi:hypothetical protein
MRQVVGQVLAVAWIRLLARRPFAAFRGRHAAASAAAAAADCATEQMPQMRGTMTSASSGCAPVRMCSKPR